MINPARYTILTCTSGYILTVASAIAGSIIVGMVTGYYPSFAAFTGALVTLRLVEIHPGFLIAPLLVAILTMLMLSRTSVNRRLVAGLSVASYYLLVALIFVILGAGDFPIGILTLWLIWIFALGVAASIIADKLHTRYFGSVAENHVP